MYLLFIVFLECPLHGAMTVFFSHGHFCVPAPRTQPGRDAVGCHFCRTTERCSGGCKRQKRRPFWRGAGLLQAPPTGPSPAQTCSLPSSPRSWLGAMRCFSLWPPSHFLQLSRKPGAAGRQIGGAGPPLAAPPQQPSAAALGMLSRQGRFSSRSRKLGCSGCKERRRGENGALHQW